LEVKMSRREANATHRKTFSVLKLVLGAICVFNR